MQLGILYGVSVGTGDPELITVKGLRILQNTEIIAFPQGIKGKPGVAQRIINQWLTPQQKTIPLNFPYVREQNILESAWQVAANIVWEYLKQGKDVAFACEGDVSLYSTFTHLAIAIKELDSDLQVITIPGVCSPVAAASDLQIPLTMNQEKLTIIPGIYHVAELEKYLDTTEVLVILKFASIYREIWQILNKRNLLNSSWIVEKASSSDRNIYKNLEFYSDLKLSYFSLLIIRSAETL